MKLGAMDSPWHYISTFWRSWALVLVPILSLLVFLVPASESDKLAVRCGYVLAIMAGWWITEALPMPITSLVPIIAFPLLGILSTNATCLEYMRSVNFMFFGGLVLAVGVENVGLHKRIGLFMLTQLGTTLHMIMLSFIITTAFLSMWISNTASTAIMLPIADAVADTLVHNAPITEEGAGSLKRQFLLLGVAYGANIGGTGVITGTPTNLVLPGKLDTAFGTKHPLTYLTWILFAVPVMLVNLVTCWVWLSALQYWRLKKYRQIRLTTNTKSDGITLQEVRQRDASSTTLQTSVSEARLPAPTPAPLAPLSVSEVVAAEYLSLGPMSLPEKQVGLLFLLLVLLWVTKDPRFVPGWGEWFAGARNKNGDPVSVGDATPAILAITVLVALPSKLNFWPFVSLASSSSSRGLAWWSGLDGIEKRLTWGVLLLLGGGFALSEGCAASGLSEKLADALLGLEALPGWVTNVLLCLATAMVTEVASNTATANVIVPIIVEISKKICLNPIYLGLSSTLSSSYAFMLPVATAPNALVSAASGIATVDMVKIGFVLNILTVLNTVLLMNTFGRIIFTIDQMPEWTGIAQICNANASSNTF